MKDRLIEILRSVPITDKTYSEYIEAVAERLLANEYSQAPNVERNVAREIFAEIEEGIKAAVSALQFNNNPIHRQVKHETYSSLMRFVKTIEKKYTEDTNVTTKESEGEG